MAETKNSNLHAAKNAKNNNLICAPHYKNTVKIGHFNHFVCTAFYIEFA